MKANNINNIGNNIKIIIDLKIVLLYMQKNLYVLKFNIVKGLCIDF